MSRTPEQIDAIALVGDFNWRRGFGIHAVIALALGRRENIQTHLGHVLVVDWWRGQPYPRDIISKPKARP
jgi:hypothetical protein